MSKTGAAISTRRIVLRVIKSALEIYTKLLRPAPKMYTRECSRNLPTMLVTLMFPEIRRACNYD